MDVERRTGIRLTENAMMIPAASISGFIFSHPRSQYFTVGKIPGEQLDIYRKKEGIPDNETDKWLAAMRAE